ncbi:MAG TPA: TraR/DksA family transcriptional regulator [Bacteroidetes bacterium]|nr:TraR/DksA family transcriptional regulator [Bacteroidota bacterium]
MTKKELKILRDLLLQRRQEILERVGASSEEIGMLQAENAADWVDRVSLDDAMNNLMSKESELARELEGIMESIKKIDGGEYGICEQCYNGISFERLEVVPTAKYCIRCKNEIEKQQRRRPNYRGRSTIPTEIFEWYD